MRPELVSVSEDAARLVIEWRDGTIDEIPAPMLRARARDAASVHRRETEGVIVAPADLTIAAAEPVGAMGVNLVFSDGHARAIYPWLYLSEIAQDLEQDLAQDIAQDLASPQPVPPGSSERN